MDHDKLTNYKNKQTTSHRTTIMHPGMHKASTSTDLLIGLYHSVRTENEKVR
jgi:hypothetical protein